MNKFLLLAILLKTCTAEQQQALNNSCSTDIDNFNNVFTISNGLEIVKTNVIDKDTSIYSLANYGLNPVIDATFPLQIVVFFTNNGKLVLLDNQLNILETQELFSHQLATISHFGRAVDGNYLWFNVNTKTIQKINNTGEVLLQSNICNINTSNYMQRIIDHGTEIWIQDGENLHQYSPALQYLGTKKGFFIRNYQYPSVYVNNMLQIEINKQKKIVKWQADTIPMAITEKHVLLQTKNGLILQSINYAK